MRYLLIFLLISGWLSLFAQPFSIGTQVVTYQDPARNNRNIQTYLYYPASSGGNGAPFASGAFPIVVIGHGFTMNYAPYVVYADTLVPQGYIVAIVNTETGFSPSHSNYALDLGFIVQKLYSENNNTGSIFYQHVLTRSCIMGHSMGGGCSLLAAEGNSNVTCTATLALANTNPSAINAALNVTAPSLIFSGSDDCVTPAATHQTPAYNNLPGCKSFVSIIDGGHCGFAGNNFNCNFGEMSCNPGGPALSSSAQQAIVCHLLRPWLERFLYDNAAAGAVYASRLANLAAANSISYLNPCAALSVPVELVEFTLISTGKGVVARWHSGEESALHHYVVERSRDALTFEALAELSPLGSNKTYVFLDKNPFKGDNYYRLCIYNQDGSRQYSGIKHFSASSNNAAVFFPNPSSGAFHLLEGDKSETLKAIRLTTLGAQDVDVIQTGPNQWRFSNTTPNGLYLVRFITQEDVLGQSVIFLHR